MAVVFRNAAHSGNNNYNRIFQKEKRTRIQRKKIFVLLISAVNKTLFIKTKRPYMPVNGTFGGVFIFAKQFKIYRTIGEPFYKRKR